MGFKIFLLNFISTALMPQKEDEIFNDLGDLIEPSVVKFNFDTIGWKILFGLSLLIIIVLSVLFVIRYIKNKYRRTALKDLNNFITEKNNTDHLAIVNYANLTLKKIAISVYGRNDTANLYGTEWISFLDSKTKKTNFEQMETVFSKASFKHEEINSEECNQIVVLTQKWIQTHA